MAEDTLSAFAWALAIQAAHIRADHEPEDAVGAMADMLDVAKRDPAGWLERNRPQASGGQEPRALNAADIYRNRARQVGGER